MSVHVLRNLLNELRKSNAMRGLPIILSLYRNKINKFNNTRARMLDYIWAVTRDFLQSGILTSVDSNEPMQSSCKLRSPKWCSASRLTLKEYSSD